MNNNKMSRQEKEAIFNKYKNNQNKKKTDSDILKNEGIKCKFGNEVFTVKALEWDDATEFENKVQEIFVKIDGMQKFAKNGTIDVGVDTITSIMLCLLNEDLQQLGEKATAGIMTMDYIREKHATKKDVINIIIVAISENFGAIKNLLAQRPI